METFKRFQKVWAQGMSEFLGRGWTGLKYNILMDGL